MLRKPVVGQVLKRGASAAAAAVKESPSAAAADHVVKTTRLPNGLMVCSIDREGALSRLAVAFRAGSRYENDQQRGVTHRIRNCVGLGTENRSAYDCLYRNGMLGADLAVTLNRDLFVVHLGAYRDYALPALEVLGEVACKPGFKQWELADTADYLTTDRQLMKKNAAVRVNELFHRAAYRNGSLGHSIFAPSSRITKFKQPQLHTYTDAHFVAGEAAIVGINVDHQQLIKYAQQTAPVNEGKAHEVPESPYHGGEEYKYTYDTPYAHVLIGGKVAGLNDAQGAAAAAVLSALIGTGPAVKWSAGCGSTAAAQAAAKASNNSPFLLSTMTSTHFEQGLFGIYAVSEAATIGPVVKSAFASLKKAASTAPTVNELNAAKAKTAAHLLMRAEDSGRLLEDFVAQTLAGGVAANPAELVDAVNKVSAADVQKVASQIVSKPSYAAVGAIQHLPQLDQL